MSRTVYTVGHSTRSADELIELLSELGVRQLADVRRFPSSRRNPQHNRAALERTLAGHGIGYTWLGESLGGRRKASLPLEESPNRAWRVPAFRSYADAMQSPEFIAGVEALEALARAQPTAFMCAERLWWQCHRRLLADLFVVRGWVVEHLLDLGRNEPHALSEWARVENGVLSYPALV